MKECEFMSAIKHPNIVQFLGTHQDLQTGLPVLITELMDESLTHFLESLQDEVPYHIQVNFCHDITLAISYLHSNGIIHRDLSSNNVLLCGTVKAKVTDFGMAKLGEINLQASHVSFTICPGTDAYMPPEAVKERPVYTEKIDCFSFGVIIIQILTKCFPDPGDRQKAKQIDHPELPDGMVYVPVPEIEWRQNHISLVNPNDPLLLIALDCLKDSDDKRPSAQELCYGVANLKETHQFVESVTRAQERPEEIRELQQQVQEIQQEIQDKNEENCQMRQEHTHQIQELQQVIESQNDCLLENEANNREKQHKLKQKDDIIREKDQLIAAKERRLQQVTEELKSNEQVMAQYQTRIQELEQYMKRKSPSEVQVKQRQSFRDLPQPYQPDTSMTTARKTKNSLALTWREGKNAPCEISRGSDAVVHGDVAYFTSKQTIYAYISNNKTWNELPQCITENFSLVIVNNFLTTIGGKDNNGNTTNKLISLARENGTKIWRAVFPPMPTKRSSSAVVCTEQVLIVAGGWIEEGMTLRTVEIMDLQTQEWKSAPSLPEPLYNASATICDDRIYIIGAWSESDGHTRSVYTCNLTDFLESCQQSQLKAQSLLQTEFNLAWEKVADLPVRDSTCVTLNMQLLAIGGYNSDKDTPTADVHQYYPSSNTWEAISKMKTSRWCCFAAVLPTNELMVVGGCTTSELFSDTASVEIAMVNNKD